MRQYAIEGGDAGRLLDDRHDAPEKPDEAIWNRGSMSSDDGCRPSNESCGWTAERLPWSAIKPKEPFGLTMTKSSPRADTSHVVE